MSEKQSLIDARPEESKRLHPNSIKASRISHGIFAIILMIGGSVASFFAASWYLLLIITAVVLLIFLSGYIWARKSYQYTWYWLTEEGLYIQRGVQHTDVGQGPLQRKFSLAKLVVYTAGTRDASVPLDGLEFEVANELREQLRQDGDDDAV